MSEFKTPGVYVAEKKAFPNSVVEVATAIPAFIGFTKKAVNGSQNLLNVPFRISSMMEFEEHFGGYMKCELVNKAWLKELIDEIIPDAQPANFVADGGTGTDYTALVTCKKTYLNNFPEMQSGFVIGTASYLVQFCKLYQHIRLYFANGGGSCYVVSVGGQDDAIKKGVERKNKFIAGIASLEKEQEPTLLVIPDAVDISKDECYAVYKEMLSHCGKMKNRFTILDIYDGNKNDKTVISDFRSNIGDNYLNFGSSYYPWLDTTITSLRTIKEDLILDSILYLLAQEMLVNEDEDDCENDYEDIIHNLYRFLLHYFYDIVDSCATNGCNKDKLKEVICYCIGSIDDATIEEVCKDNSNDNKYKKIGKAAKKTLLELTKVDKEKLAIEWCMNGKNAELILKAYYKKINSLLPSAAMAGIYAMVDSTRGVWKAPANVSLNMVLSPMVDLTDEEQQDLNASNDGKSINAIRSFTGSGVKVWGARTLDGNNLDWRYINVRRTMNFLEASIKNAARSYVFEPNDANTWLNMKCMIENFLRNVWKRGGLAGTSPEDAYSVHIGLGETMTPEDILEGVMRVTVLVAVSHPAEFIEITFQQQMQKS